MVIIPYFPDSALPPTANNFYAVGGLPMAETVLRQVPISVQGPMQAPLAGNGTESQYNSSNRITAGSQEEYYQQWAMADLYGTGDGVPFKPKPIMYTAG